jgi:hypothetical protein
VAAANAEATRQIEAAAVARAAAKEPTVFGPPRDAVRDELLIGIARQRAEAAAADEAAAAYYAAAEARKAALAKSQAEATEL